MSQRLGVLVMGACLLLYILLLGHRAVLLLTSADPVAITMGVAMLVLPLVGAWALGREIQFGVEAGRLGRRAEKEGALPEEDVEITPSGRLDRTQAAPLLARYEAEAHDAPADWRALYRLGLVQDAAGKRKDARASLRAAIRSEKAERAAAAG